MSKPADKSRWILILTNLFRGNVISSQPPPSVSPAPMPSLNVPEIQNFEDYLLQPADDATLRDAWVYLDLLIDSHVKSFYQSDRVVGSIESIAKYIDEYEVVTGRDRIHFLPDLVYWPQYRSLGLRICIARILLSSIEPHGDCDDTSLPREVVALLEKFHEVHPAANAVDDVALAKWRILTAFLLSPSSKTSKKGAKKEEVFPCEETLDELLERFSKNVDRQSELEAEEEADRKQSLHTLAAECAAFGKKLLAHPSTWTFQWAKPSTPHSSRSSSQDTENGTDYLSEEEGNGIVLFPALLRSDAPSKARKQKGRPVLVHPAVIGSGFVSQEINVLEKKKTEPIPLHDSGFTIHGPRDIGITRSSTGQERAIASRAAVSRRPSSQVEPHYATNSDTDHRIRAGIQQPAGMSRSQHIEGDFGSQRDAYDDIDVSGEAERLSRRRTTRRRKNKHNSGAAL